MPAIVNARAERLLQWKRDGVEAAAEFEAKERATRLLTVKLRTERLAREATRHPEEGRESISKTRPRKISLMAWPFQRLCADERFAVMAQAF